MQRSFTNSLLLTLLHISTGSAHAVTGVGDAHSATNIRCDQVITKLDTSSKDINILKVKGTRDSVSDGRYYATGWGLKRKPDDEYQQSFDVHGQVFDVRKFTGPDREQLQGHSRFVLIWWGVTPGCGRYKPIHTVQHVGAVVVLSASPRKREEWIGGLPTFDVPNATFLYVNGKSMFER